MDPKLSFYKGIFLPRNMVCQAISSTWLFYGQRSFHWRVYKIQRTILLLNSIPSKAAWMIAGYFYFDGTTWPNTLCGTCLELFVITNVDWQFWFPLPFMRELTEDTCNLSLYISNWQWFMKFLDVISKKEFSILILYNFSSIFPESLQN